MKEKKLSYVNYIYKNMIISKFISTLMQYGNKSKMELSMNLIFKLIKFYVVFNPIFLLFEAIEKLKPVIDLKKMIKSRKSKKIKEIVPFEIVLASQFKRACFFLIESTKKMAFNFFLCWKLAEEVLAMFFFTKGSSIQKKMSLYKYSKFKKYKRYFRW